jgi:ribosomal protein L11 methylase PrmA
MIEKDVRGLLDRGRICGEESPSLDLGVYQQVFGNTILFAFCFVGPTFMTDEQIGKVLAQAISSPEFRDLLFHDPDQALAGYSLTDAEKNLLRLFTPDKLYRMLGDMLAYRVIPIRASRRFVTVFSENKYMPEPGTLPILLGPQIAFGGGFHETTQLCLAALEETVLPGASVFDLGTGTGILAIAAVKLGAASVLAVDIMPEAVAAANENVDLNDVAAKVRVEQGSLNWALNPPGEALPRQFDVVVANLLAPIIIEMIGQGLVRTLTSNGVLILSGLRLSQQMEITGALRQNGMAITEVQQSGDWVCLTACQMEPQQPAIR